MDERDDAEDERLRGRQDAVIHPLGRALRATYDAENHETLGAEVTALMIALSRIPYEPHVKAAVVAAPVARTLIGRMRGFWAR